MSHARLSASSSTRWINCPGSPRLIAQLPEEPRTSYEGAEGSAAHLLAEKVLQTHQPAESFLGQVWSVHDHKITIDREMIDYVLFYLESLSDERSGDVIKVEMALTDALTRLHPDLGGTADYVRYRPGTRHLQVVDLKYGRGLLVVAAGNKQLMTYALGAMLTLGVSPETVAVCIVQPRIEHPEGRIREVVYTGLELVEFGAQLVEAARATTAPDAALNPGAWCKFCPAAATCPALIEKRNAMMKVDLPEFGLVNKAALVTALAMIEPLRAQITAVERAAYHEAVAGRLGPADGWKLVQKRAVRRWANEAQAEQSLIGVLPAEAMYEPAALRSPAQLERALGGKKGKALLAGLVVSESSGTVLVPASDPRPEAVRAGDQDFAALPGAAEAQLPGADMFD